MVIKLIELYTGEQGITTAVTLKLLGTVLRAVIFSHLVLRTALRRRDYHPYFIAKKTEEKEVKFWPTQGHNS